jgi:tRNA(Arg) A34 adenosine deaminase TadA
MASTPAASGSNDAMLNTQLHLTLPAWVHEEVDAARRYPDAHAQVALAIQLSRRNVENSSGGPFGAAVFDGEGRLLGVGVNRVIPQNCSLAHAETMAFMLAQQHTQRHRLNENGEHIVLATSSQPCCMCYGASFWAGIDSLRVGARAEDVMELTEFDEGPLPADWIGELTRRGIEVERDILRDHARDVLRQYSRLAGQAY